MLCQQSFCHFASHAPRKARAKTNPSAVPTIPPAMAFAAASRSTTPATAPDIQSSTEEGVAPSGFSKIGLQQDARVGSSDETPRLENTTACLPFIYGSVAFYLGNKADDYNTHKWTLYLRGPSNEDLSVCIAKVVFQLHPSFASPVRELTSPPFEVTEQGWGEFEAQIRIVWKDTSEKSTLVRFIVENMSCVDVFPDLAIERPLCR